MVNYIQKLKDKCNLSDEFVNIILELLEKLHNFGYITSSDSKKLEKKLYENIDYVSIGNNNSLDYKSGYYDASKKELYIKDISNTESIYLRLIYILTTNKVSEHAYNVGYSRCQMSHSNYKIIHENFGINRAITSNLVCRILYTLPTTLSIVPTYRTYENDFLGNKINSDNDIYYLEGKILKQLCYILNINEEDLYVWLFSNSPSKHLEKLFAKSNSSFLSTLLSIFDNISRKYSNYNKLCYLNNLLDKNYIDIKKNILNSDISNLKQKENKIKNEIRTALSKLDEQVYVQYDNVNSNENFNILDNLAEKITDIENDIISGISSIQNFLVDYLVSKENSYFIIDYVVKLKKFNDMLVTENKKLKEFIYKIINEKLIKSTNENSSNLIDKIKYSLINEVLNSDKYLKLYNELCFKVVNIPEIENKNLLVLTAYDSFLQLVSVDYLNNSMRLLTNNAKSIELNNLKYLHDNPSATNDIQKIETIFSKIKNDNKEYKNLRIENFYLFNFNNNSYLLALYNEKFDLFEMSKENNEYYFNKLNMSEYYKVFNLYENSNLPVLYKKESLFDKVLSFFKVSFSN